MAVTMLLINTIVDVKLAGLVARLMMLSVDSDSSDEEDFTTTNVLLGYASKEPTDDGFSQLGGFPVRPSNHITTARLTKA